MQVKQKVKNDCLVCNIVGEVNIDNVAELKKVFYKIIEDKSRKVVLNLKGLEYIDSSGMACFIEFFKGLKDIQGTMFLCSITPKIMSIFAITKLDKVFKVYDSEDEALKDSYGY